MATIEPDHAKRRRSKKRANGQGSIYQRKDGRWAGAAYVLAANGTYKRTPVYGSSAEDVGRKLTEIKARSDQGLPAQAAGWTVASYSTYWLEHVARPKLRPTTFARYRSLLSRYIMPSIGKRRLTALTPADVRLMLARVASSPVRVRETGMTPDFASARTVQQVHAVLRSMLNTAVREELVARNVARLVQPPTPEHEEIHPWTDEEARRFLKAADGHRLYALFAVALALGLRRGELLGLRWSDIDFRKRQLRVAQTLQRVRGEGLVFGPPKSKRSRRTLTMPSFVVAALSCHRIGQAEDRRRAAEAWVDTGLVFTTSSGRHLEPRNLNTAYSRLLAHVDVPHIRFHDLRLRCVKNLGQFLGY